MLTASQLRTLCQAFPRPRARSLSVGLVLTASQLRTLYQAIPRPRREPEYDVLRTRTLAPAIPSLEPGICADPSLSVRLVLTASQLRTLCQAFPRLSTEPEEE